MCHLARTTDSHGFEQGRRASIATALCDARFTRRHRTTRHKDYFIMAARAYPYGKKPSDRVPGGLPLGSLRAIARSFETVLRICAFTVRVIQPSLTSGISASS